jgi:lipopolysaccharide transport system ATP-binding protein
MGSIAIRAEMLGKRYRIGAPRVRHRTLREAMMSAAAAPLRNLGRLRALTSFEGDAGADTIWALRDFSFEAREGEVVGIIGRNGAGKSTLLKLLSRITEPTAGFADIYGRVGSLLEVGTGFHLELTGRDNIYLNGSILGMDRGYIDRRFDEIVEFAAIGPFLDTPVKRYSSGMYLRLAFAVAAHLEPEVLIVDEVLAVGDAEFQQKCLGRMSLVAGEGRTVLFVSHDMLDRGRLAGDGATGEMVQLYLADSLKLAKPRQHIDVSQHHRSGTGLARFVAVEYCGDRPDLNHQVYPDGPLDVILSIASDADRRVGSLGVTFCDQHGTKLVNADSLSIGQSIPLREGQTQVHLRIESLHLQPGRYRVDLWLADPLAKSLDFVESAFAIDVADIQIPVLGQRVGGLITCKFRMGVANKRGALGCSGTSDDT